MTIPRLIGVIHLPPLAGAPGSHGKSPIEALHEAGARAVEEAELLAREGFEGLIIENFGDTPFYKDRVPAETIASMAIIAAAVREATADISLGINILRNDARSALAIASVTGCDWIRVNVLSGVTATDQGIIEGDAAWLLRERERLHAHVAIFADVHVKHGVTLSSIDIGLAIEEAGTRAMADGLIVSGPATGQLIQPEMLKVASEKAREIQVPLYIGSGATADVLPELRPWVDGVIVSSALRVGGIAGQPLDPARVKAFARAFLKLGAKAKASGKAKRK